jgi:hypothetical protein
MSNMQLFYLDLCRAGLPEHQASDTANGHEVQGAAVLNWRTMQCLARMRQVTVEDLTSLASQQGWFAWW